MPKSSKPARKPAKPLSAYLDDICDQLAGGTSMRAACAALDLKESTVRFWLSGDDEARARVAAARELGCDALADQIIEIADTPQMGEIRTCKPVMVEGKPVDGAFQEEVRTEDMLGHRRLQIDARLRLLGKWSQRYGDKVALTGADGGHIKVERVERVVVDPANPDR